jgi:hypothetical protein
MVDNIKFASPDGPGAAVAAFSTSTNFVNMANYRRCRITLHLSQSGAGTATVTLKQGASSGAGTALAFSEYWKNELGTDVLTQVAATTLTTAGAYTGDNTYVFEVKADDMTEGYKLLRMNVASLSNNTAADLFYDCYEPRFAAGASANITALS